MWSSAPARVYLEGLRHWGLQDKLDSLETRRIEIEVKLTAAPAPEPRIHPNLAKLYRRKGEALREALDDPDIRDEALEILRRLIDSVSLVPHDKGFEIELVGNIAKMIAAPTGGASEPIQNGSSVKLVAGARLRRESPIAYAVL